MNWQLNISAGEFFDLIRPAMFVIAALLSSWVFAGALRRRFSLPVAGIWVIGTLLFPLIVFPLYLLALLVRRRRQVPINNLETGPSLPLAMRLIPLVYLILALVVFAIFFYRDQRTVDAHLARATHARLSEDRGRIIREYRAALALEDDPYTRKLLAIELAEAGFLTEALAEFRRAERDGEVDDLLSFRIAVVLEALNQSGQAELEYRRFIASSLCVEAMPDTRCEIARAKVAAD
ncbi:MAG TPA: hypothetical protein VMM84_01095 [Pyrinomonadaceae bacterium]|nr:hypothetical protein [Pyrinomonadaceae bacterium]